MSYPPQPGSGQTPVCPRHPDRATYVRCQRCEQPVCPECQRPATVGVRCVDCAAQAQRAARPARTAAGARVRNGTPYLTYGIIVVCVALELLRYVHFETYVEVYRALVFAPRFGLTEPYRFVTSTFLHGGIWHLAFNMYALWLIGNQLERLLGRWRFLALYLLSAVGGSVGYLAIAGPHAVATVGASGGVFGLFAAFAIFMRRLGGNPNQILVVIGINLVLGFVLSGIAWQAHLGGMAVGAAVAAVFAYINPHVKNGIITNATREAAVRRAATWQWLACAGILVVLIGIVAIVYTVA